MSSLTYFALFIQAILIQNAFGQLINAGGYGLNALNVEVDAISSGAAGLRGYGLNNGALGLGNAAIGLGNVGLGNAGLGLGLGSAGLVGSGLTGYGGVSNVAASASLPVAGPFVANGVGELAVGGEIGASGTTVVTGQVPVLGAVSFSGSIPASGVVSIAGNCGCAGVPL